jgi:hypothetical protein
MFTMLALLTPGSPEVPIETLAEKAQSLFAHEVDFRLQYETLPFKKTRNIKLQWTAWSVRLFAENGASARDDALEIARILGKDAPAGIAESTHRVRAVFNDDPQEDYINHMVQIMTMMEELEGAVVFDPQQNKLMD